jgi:hypothetical protein
LIYLGRELDLHGQGGRSRRESENPAEGGANDLFLMQDDGKKFFFLHHQLSDYQQVKLWKVSKTTFQLLSKPPFYDLCTVISQENVLFYPFKRFEL